jgi:hypothetical protein
MHWWSTVHSLQAHQVMPAPVLVQLVRVLLMMVALVLMTFSVWTQITV